MSESQYQYKLGSAHKNEWNPTGICPVCFDSKTADHNVTSLLVAASFAQKYNHSAKWDLNFILVKYIFPIKV